MRLYKYTVSNVYGISGETNHNSLDCAIKERNSREGDGWVVNNNETGLSADGQRDE